MAERLGIVYVELDLDKTKFERNQQQIIQQANATALSIEKNYQILGIKSDNIYNAMAQGAINAYTRIINAADTSAAEQVRAQASMVAKVNSLNMEMTRNPLYETLGIRSVAAINAQKEAVMTSFNTISQNVQKGSQDWINIERAKNDKLKELNKEMVGHHDWSMAAMARAVLRLYAAYYVLSNAIKVLLAPLEKGLSAVEELNTSVASMAAMVVSFSERAKGVSMEEQWKKALVYSQELIPVLERVAAKTLLSGQETTALANAFARSGVFLQANNAAQMEGFVRLSNALPLMTKGQEIMRQINTEIRALMSGANTPGSMLIKTLEAIDPLVEKNLKLWRAQGTVMENIGRLLEGFGPATGILENQWQAVKTTIDTTVTQILRAGMLVAYGEIITSVKDLNKYLEQNKDSFIEGITVWLGNFMLGLFTVKAEILRLGMLLDKIGGTLTQMKALLYVPGTFFGAESSTERFNTAIRQNKELEERYKASEKELENLAKRYIELEKAISSEGLVEAKRMREGTGTNEIFKAKPLGSTPEEIRKVEEIQKLRMETWIKDEAHKWEILEKYEADYTKIIEKAASEEMALYEKRSEENEKYLEKMKSDNQKAADKAYQDEMVEFEDRLKEADKYFADQKSLNEKRLTAERSIYKDLRGYANQYYEANKSLILSQAKEYRELGIGEVAISAWVAEEFRKLEIQKLRASGNFFDGVKAGWMEIEHDSENWASNVADLTQKAFDGMADALTEFVWTGKMNFADFANSIIKDLIRIQIRQSLMGMFGYQGTTLLGSIGTAISGVFTGGTTTVPGIVAHSGGVVGQDSFPQRMIPAPVLSMVPRYHSGLSPDESLGIFQRGETIIPKGQSRTPDVKIVVNNRSGQQVNVSKKDVSFNPQEMIVTLWLDAAQNNKFGLRTAMGG